MILLALVSLLLGWLAFGLHAWITFYNVLVVWILLAVVLFYQIRKVNRDVSRFFEVINDQDAIQHFDLSKSDPVFIDLHRQMNQVIMKFARLRNEKERDYQFFRTIFDHADAGLLVHDEKGRILLINKAANLLLGTSNPAELTEIVIPGNLKPGVRKLVRINNNGDRIHLSLRSRRIKSAGKQLTLISLQNIRQELEQQEVESWQKLIRVFIHEIMNSVSPITLTASGILAIMEKSDLLPDQDKDEILEGLRAIRKRSKGIAAFMDSYRQLSRTPVPEFSEVPVARLTENVGQLMMKDFQSRNINFTINITPKETRIWCDEKLIEHVLINLLKNASDVLVNTTSPEIRLSCVTLLNRVELSVQDNGPGIDPEILENIFVPFFTTKPDGTGIGLSLSRQIMNLHGGNIFVNSKKGNTVFTLNFNN
jgi:nitrogen fixation/metabolism regulation signal transduction histidine kinase